MSYKIARDIKYDVFWYLVRKDISFFDERKTGDILSRISQDVQVLQDGLSTSISMLMRCGYVIVCVIIILASISWKLTLCAIAGIAVTSTGMKYFWSKGFQLGKEVQEKKAGCTEVSEEAISNIRTVKAFACEGEEKAKFKIKNDEVYKKGQEQSLFEGIHRGWVGIMINSTNGMIIYVGNKLFERKEITIGELTAFLLYMILLIFNFIVF